jgi:hypothetical protein
MRIGACGGAVIAMTATRFDACRPLPSLESRGFFHEIADSMEIGTPD